MFELFNVSFILALRAWIMHEDQILSSGPSNLIDIARGDIRLARAFHAPASAYYDPAMVFGIPRNPDLLLRLRPVGMLIHAVVCQTKSTWAALYRGVDRRYPDLPSLIPLAEHEQGLESYNELLVFRFEDRRGGGLA